MELIYIVDDDFSVAESLCNALIDEGYAAKFALSPEEFIALTKQQSPVIAILDICFGSGNMDGETLVKYCAENHPDTTCIMISGETDIKKTIDCLKHGAIDFLEKPVSLPRLLTCVKNVIRMCQMKATAVSRFKLLGKSKIIKDTISRIRKLASLNESVLITGESGTGKEIVAENIHHYSSKFALPMIKVNCAALNSNLIESELFGHAKGSFTGATSDKKGYFETAKGSSLFIDEIGDFPVQLQSKILRVLQEKKVVPLGTTSEIYVDTRLLFATHCNLGTMIKNKTFREDLYYRLSTFTIVLPPLRERLEDIDELSSYFLSLFIAENNMPYKEFSSSALDKLKQYHYPGNIRELSKIVKNCACFSIGDVIGPEDIHFESIDQETDLLDKTRTMTLSQAKDSFEKALIKRRFEFFNKDPRSTAQSLGILPSNIYRFLKKHSIEFNETN
jgi:DNA-binding NtrC family response regulator